MRQFQMPILHWRESRLIDVTPLTGDVLRIRLRHLTNLPAFCSSAPSLRSLIFISKPLVKKPLVPGYLMLSYTWGGRDVFKLTSKTVEAMKEKIEIQLLPRTIRQAIWLTRKLGFSYIWIDSLCILQESSDDWGQESSKKAETYEIQSVHSRLWIPRILIMACSIPELHSSKIHFDL